MMQSCESKQKAFRSKRNQNGLTYICFKQEKPTQNTQVTRSFLASKHPKSCTDILCMLVLASFMFLKKYLLINTNISTNTSTHFLLCFYFLLIPYSPNSTHQIIFLHPPKTTFSLRTKNTKWFLRHKKKLKNKLTAQSRIHIISFASPARVEETISLLRSNAKKKV